MPTEPVKRSFLISVLERTADLVMFVAVFARKCFSRPFEGRELVRQMDEAGSKSLLLVMVTGLSIGVVLSMQSRATLARFGAESVLPSMIALSVIKEIGPVLTSLVLAGRLGAGIAAEIGSMRVTEQIDALEVAALKPFNYLVVTRVLACMVMFPVLTTCCDVVAILGGFLESAVASGMHYKLFVDSAFESVRISDLVFSTAKTSVFGFIVGIVGCSMGYNVRGGTRDVGQNAMQAVVLSSLLILIVNVVLVRISLILLGG